MNTPSRKKIQIKRKNIFPLTAILILVWLFSPFFLVQFVCLFFLFILAGSRAYTEYLVRNIRVERMDTELRVFRHEWVKVEVKIENHGHLPAFMLVLGDLPGDLHVFKMQKTFCTLLRRSWTVISWDGLCSERGVFSIGPAVIRGADPLGLFPFQLTASETTRLYVYPVLRSITIKNSRGVPLGNLISSNPMYEDITRYRSLRPYHRGDETRRINWKASIAASSVAASSVAAGSGYVSGGQLNVLLVNEYEATASYPVMIFLNVNQDEYPIKKRKVFIERTIEAAAALCLKASRERQEIGIIIYKSNFADGTLVISPSAFTLIPILETLAALEWSRPGNEGDNSHEDKTANSMITMLNYGKYLPYGTRYLYAGPDPGDEAYANLNMLKRHHLSLEYLIIDEKSMPLKVPGGSVCYQMKENGYEII